MKKQILMMFTTLCLLLVLLPTTARADGVTEYAGSYEEAVKYLAENTRLQSLYIEGEGFSWPSGDVTLDLTAASSGFDNVQIIGDWVIPENVTVVANEAVSCGGSVTVNGTWEHNYHRGISMYAVAGSRFTVNGKLSLPDEHPFDLFLGHEEQDVLYLNGELELKGTRCNILQLVLGDGAKVTETDTSSLLRILDGGSITVPSGSARIDTQLETGDHHNVSTVEDCTISGNLHVAQLEATSRDRFVISKGSCVTTDYLRMSGSSEARMSTMQVDGVLRLADVKYHNFDRYACMTLGKDGTLVLDPGVNLEDQDAAVTIDGTGTIICSGVMRDWGNGRISVSREAELFESWQQEGGWPAQVAKSVTIVRYSLDEDKLCEEHTWVNEERHEPTCGVDSYTSAECSTCYVWSNHDYGNDATGDHTPDRYRMDDDGNAIEVRCGECYFWGTITLSAPEKVAYTGQPVTPAAISGDGAGWAGGSIVYSDNTEPGTATASLTLGECTISTTFKIVAPLTVESAGGGVTAEICLSNLPEALRGGSVRLVAALYEDGRMVGAEVKSVTVGEGGTVEESLEVQYGTQVSPDNCKVFILDSEGKLPLLDALRSSMG